MNKHVRQMMIDLRLLRQEMHNRRCWIRRRVFKSVRRFPGMNAFTRRQKTTYHDVTWNMFTYARRYDGCMAFVRTRKTAICNTMLKRHLAWSMCNAMVEDTIRCAEEHNPRVAFDRREYVDIAITDWPSNSHN